MTDEQQRIAIAEACGWKKSDLWSWDGQTCYEHDKHDPRTESKLPDYPNDLNVMHEAEKLLSVEQEFQYSGELSAFFEGISALNYGATARQRAEAFLRTLKLWKD